MPVFHLSFTCKPAIPHHGPSYAFLSICEIAFVNGLLSKPRWAENVLVLGQCWLGLLLAILGVGSVNGQAVSPLPPEAINADEFEIPEAGSLDSPLSAEEFDEGFYGNREQCDCPHCQSMRGSRRPLVIGPGRCFMLYEVRVSADYLLYSIDGMNLPALVTTSPVGTAAANIGVLGGNTQTLFGGNTINDDMRSGGRIGVSLWTDPTMRTAWEASYFGLEQKGDDYSATSNSIRNLARPVFDTGTNREAAQLVAQSGVLAGSINVQTDTQLQAIELVRRSCFMRTQYYQCDLLLGYKYGLLEDQLNINQSSTYLAATGPIVAGTSATAFDRFSTSNRFNGFLIGLDRWHNVGCWKFVYTGKVALGANRSRVDINGQTTTTVPNVGSSTITGNLLAQSTNIGRHERDQFMAIPEFTFRLERRMSPQIQLHAAYNLMYWTAVTRVDDTLSRRVSQFPPEAVTGTREPAFRWNDSGLFMHGLQVGVDYNF